MVCTSKRPTGAVVRHKANGHRSKILIQDRHSPVGNRRGQLLDICGWSRLPDLHRGPSDYESLALLAELSRLPAIFP